MGLRGSERISRIPQAISVRRGCNRDVNYVRDIDLKSYQYPWDYDQWKVVGESKTHHWCVAIKEAQPIGFAVWEDSPKGYADAVKLLRLGVKPAYRGLGAGMQLLDYVLDYAEDSSFKRFLTIVPEIYCLPGHPDDVSEWLLHRGLHAVPPIVKEHAYMYGEWVDGFIFTTSLTGRTNESST